MSQLTSTVADPALTVIGATARCLTVAVPWNPLAWMNGSRGPRSVPLVGTRRMVARTVSPTAYPCFTTTSTRPFGTAVGRTRSPVATGVAGGGDEHAATASARARAARARIGPEVIRAGRRRGSPADRGAPYRGRG